MNKILLISDDIRGSSGVSHICKTLVTESVNSIKWVQLAALRDHPEQGSIVDLSESVDNYTKTKGSFVRLYPISGYGTDYVVRNIINTEEIDGILHMSDPRNFGHLYTIDHEIRNKIPLMYYHVWDNDPIPYFNESIYKSCDWIGCINKLTFDHIRQISPSTPCDYIPHGVSDTVFHKISETDKKDYAKKILGNVDYDFVIFSNNVNIPRKQLPLLFESIQRTKEVNSNKKICLLVHVNPSSTDVRNLKTISRLLCPDVDIVFSETTLSLHNLNLMYNISDITINIASNEGFGLSTLESLMTETPIIATDTGGLSDQMKYLNDDNNLVTGEWAYAVKPKVRRLVSGGTTAYIYEDICSPLDVSDGVSYWLSKDKNYLEECGKLGRDFAINNFNTNQMVSNIVDKMITTIENHKQDNFLSITKI